GGSGKILTSPDGVTWTIQSSGTSYSLNGVTYGNGQYVTVGGYGKIFTSPDGVTWTSRSSGTSRELYDVTFGNGQYVTVGHLGMIVTSPGGIMWTSRSSGTVNALHGGTYGNGKFVGVGDSGMILQSGAVTQPLSMSSPEILVQPADQSVPKFGSVSFSVTGDGVKPFSYCWLLNGVGIPGQVNSSLVLDNVGVGQAGEYSVLVSNAFGVVTSDVATLTVLLPPTILVPPQNRTALAGGAATFSVVVNGDAPFTYAWRHDGVTLPGASDEMLTVSDIQSSDAGTYSVIVSSAGGSVESASATLVLGTPANLIITSQYAGAVPGVGTNIYARDTRLRARVANSPTYNGSTQYVCRGWLGSGSVPSTGVTDDTGYFTLTNDTSIAWLWLTNLWLDTEIVGQGDVNVVDGWYGIGSNLLMTASASNYWRFSGWSGDTSGCPITSNTITVVMDRPRSVMAILAADMATNNTPKWWLAQYGLTNFNADAMRDVDHDGMLTWEEWVAGCDPTNINSVFRFTSADGAPGEGIVVRWPSISNRFYTLQHSTNLYMGSNGFVILPGASNLPGTPTENVYTDSVPATGVNFYRIEVHQ
ncbi:MAG: immunoglobulin domain-containing protein, partial [Lentisphaerae bacterium]|nr:immunoglobulin domain-containing protein [Lentisphaerota bacterium]